MLLVNHPASSDLSCSRVGNLSGELKRRRNVFSDGREVCTRKQLFLGLASWLEGDAAEGDEAEEVLMGVPPGRAWGEADEEVLLDDVAAVAAAAC